MLKDLFPNLKMVVTIVVAVVIVHQIDWYLFGGKESRQSSSES